MSAKEEMFDLFVTLSPKAENIIQRIMNLSDEQFDRLIALYAQQEQESYPACPAPHLTSA
jgi:hypothetical protein